MKITHDLIVIGAGLAGLTAAWQAAVRGQKVKVLAKGWGATHWHAGCIDVLGYYPVDSDEPVTNLTAVLDTLITDQPHHPYALAGKENLAAALDALKQLCAEASYPLEGSPAKNWLLPSAVGTFRPTCLAPATMTAGDLQNDAPMLLVGFEQIPDFYPNVAAANLRRQGIPARDVMLDLPELAQRHGTTAVILARMMEQPAFRAQVAQAVKPHVQDAERVGFTAVLGLHQATAVQQDLATKIGKPVFEIPGLPPSVPGMRLHHILKKAIERAGGRVFDGMEVQDAGIDGGSVTAIFTETSARLRHHRAARYVLATGGILGGGIQANHEGRVRETIFDLPLQAPASRQEWFRRDFLDERGHPIYQTGITVDGRFQPLNGQAAPIYQNLYAAGTTLAHCEPIRERSFDGIGLVTGYTVGQQI